MRGKGCAGRACGPSVKSPMRLLVPEGYNPLSIGRAFPESMSNLCLPVSSPFSEKATEETNPFVVRWFAWSSLTVENMAISRS